MPARRTFASRRSGRGVYRALSPVFWNQRRRPTVTHRRSSATDTTVAVTSTVTGTPGSNITTTLGVVSTVVGVPKMSGTATTTLAVARLLVARPHMFDPISTTVQVRSQPAATLFGSLEPQPPGFETLTANYRMAPRAPLRFIAQRIVDGVFLDWDVPLIEPEITYTLSGPTFIRGKLAPEVRDFSELGLNDGWSVWLHVEEDGIIRASGIIQPTVVEDGEHLVIEAAGVSAYPQEMPFWGELSEVQIDPCEVVRRIWAHLQSFPDALLGVVVSATASPVKLGEPAVQDKNQDGTPATNTDGTPKMIAAKPYQLVYYEDKDCGAEIDSLAKSTPFDYVETYTWNDLRTKVLPRIELGYPRRGGSRRDLRFAQDENLIDAVLLRETPGRYASQVVLRGKGEGRDAVRGYAGTRSTRRIRRAAVVADKTIDNVIRANALAIEELQRRQSVLSIGQITIDAYHQNAPLGSYQVGDDILVSAYIPFYGELSLSHRIIGYTWLVDADVVTLELRRSEQFAYGRPNDTVT